MSASYHRRLFDRHCPLGLDGGGWGRRRYRTVMLARPARALDLLSEWAPLGAVGPISSQDGIGLRLVT